MGPPLRLLFQWIRGRFAKQSQPPPRRGDHSQCAWFCSGALVCGESYSRPFQSSLPSGDSELGGGFVKLLWLSSGAERSPGKDAVHLGQIFFHRYSTTIGVVLLPSIW